MGENGYMYVKIWSLIKFHFFEAFESYQNKFEVHFSGIHFHISDTESMKSYAWKHCSTMPLTLHRVNPRMPDNYECKQLH